MSFALAMLIKPLVALFLFGCCALPGRIAVQKWMKPGKLKTLLLTDIGPKKPA